MFFFAFSWQMSVCVMWQHFFCASGKICKKILMNYKPPFFSLFYECKIWMFAILTNCLLQKMPKNSNHNFKAIVNIKRE